MKELLSILFSASLALTAFSQSTTPPPYTNAPTISGSLKMFTDAVAAGNTNWLFEVHGLYAPKLDLKYGGGIGAFYPINDFIFAGARLDYVNGGFWMPSGNAGLQLPIKLFGIQIKPFGYAGIGVPVSGATVGDVTIPGTLKDNAGEPTAILGYGLAFRLWTSKSGASFVDAIGDRETWSGFSGDQYRFGALFKLSF